MVGVKIFSKIVNDIIKPFKGMMLPEEENNFISSISYSPAYWIPVSAIR
jgi:hypothetical protein